MAAAYALNVIIHDPDMGCAGRAKGPDADIEDVPIVHMDHIDIRLMEILLDLADLLRGDLGNDLQLRPGGPVSLPPGSGTTAPW